MFENLIAGWKVGSAVRKLVFQDKRLLFYPLVTAAIIIVETLVIFGTMFVSFFAAGGFSFVLFIIGLFVFYVIAYFTSTYLLVAMLLAFRSFETKKQIGMGQALSQASSYGVLILEWAIFEAIIVMIIRAIERRMGALGGAIFGLVASMALSIATLFAVPVIIDKRTGPIATIKESSSFIIKNFGKTFGGLLYSELYSMIFSIAGVILLFVGIFSIGVSVILAAILAVVGIMLIVIGSMLSFTLTNVYRFILYDYKNGGKLPDGIDKSLVNSSIRRGQGLGGMFGQNQQQPGDI